MGDLAGISAPPEFELHSCREGALLLPIPWTLIA